jgi:hypothetical protein
MTIGKNTTDGQPAEQTHPGDRLKVDMDPEDFLRLALQVDPDAPPADDQEQQGQDAEEAPAD